LNGCVQYEVQPKGLKDGTIIKSTWIDEGQLILKKGAKVQKGREEGLVGLAQHLLDLATQRSVIKWQDYQFASMISVKNC